MAFPALTIGTLYAFCLVTQPFITVPVTLYALKAVWGTGSLIGKGAYYLATSGSGVAIDTTGDTAAGVSLKSARDDDWVLVSRNVRARRDASSSSGRRGGTGRPDRAHSV